MAALYQFNGTSGQTYTYNAWETNYQTLTPVLQSGEIWRITAPANGWNPFYWVLIEGQLGVLTEHTVWTSPTDRAPAANREYKRYDGDAGNPAYIDFYWDDGTPGDVLAAQHLDSILRLVVCSNATVNVNGSRCGAVLQLINCSNVTVNYCHGKDVGRGIMVEGSSTTGTINGVDIRDAAQEGIAVWDSANVTIDGAYIKNSGLSMSNGAFTSYDSGTGTLRNFQISNACHGRYWAMDGAGINTDVGAGAWTIEDGIIRDCFLGSFSGSTNASNLIQRVHYLNCQRVHNSTAGSHAVVAAEDLLQNCEIEDCGMYGIESGQSDLSGLSTNNTILSPKTKAFTDRSLEWATDPWPDRDEWHSNTNDLNIDRRGVFKFHQPQFSLRSGQTWEFSTDEEVYWKPLNVIVEDAYGRLTWEAPSGNSMRHLPGRNREWEHDTGVTAQPAPCTIKVWWDGGSPPNVEVSYSRYPALKLTNCHGGKVYIEANNVSTAVHCSLCSDLQITVKGKRIGRGVYLSECNDITVQDCEIVGYGQVGLYARLSDRITFSNNVLKYGGGCSSIAGIYLGNDCEDCLVQGNTIIGYEYGRYWWIDGSGVMIETGGRRNAVQYNTIRRCHVGIQDNSGNTGVDQNKIIGNRISGDWGFDFSSGSEPLTGDNTFYGTLPMGPRTPIWSAGGYSNG